MSSCDPSALAAVEVDINPADDVEMDGSFSLSESLLSTPLLTGTEGRCRMLVLILIQF